MFKLLAMKELLLPFEYIYQGQFDSPTYFCGPKRNILFLFPLNEFWVVELMVG